MPFTWKESEVRGKLGGREACGMEGSDGGRETEGGKYAREGNEGRMEGGRERGWE